MINVPQSRFKRSHLKRKTRYSKDKKKLAVAAYLISIYPKGATKNGIMTKAKIRSQEGTDFDRFMNDLLIMKWVEKKESESVGGYDSFHATQEGIDALNKAKELAREDHPLAKLETFQDILDF